MQIDANNPCRVNEIRLSRLIRALSAPVFWIEPRLNHADLTTKTSRKRLAPRSSAYAQILAEGRALAYRKRTAGHPGRWLLRTARLDDAGYSFEVLGTADDVAEADGREVLTYTQALAAALGRRTADPNKITVADALDAWARHKSRTASTEKRRLDIDNAARRIAAAFPKRALRSITTRDIHAWRDAIADRAGDPRSRRATADREMATLKAALTMAADLHGYERPRAWTAAKKFPKGDSFGARMLILCEEQEAAWIATGRPDVAELLTALQMTGARFGEIAAADVGDLEGDRLTLTGKSGTRTITLSPDKAAWFAERAAGRPPAAPLIARRDGERWPDGAHMKPLATAAKAAGLPDRVTSYALRHGFISRALSRGVPVLAVAQHCGTSAEMIEATYAKFTRGAMAGWFA